MKKMTFSRIVGFAFLALVLILILWIAYIYFILPRIPVPDIRVEITKERIERGKYLANHVTVCIDCHSTRDWTRFSGPITPGTEGKGGERFDEQFGFPGTFYSPNITPYGLSNWSDGEIYRAITSGVAKGNRPIFPLMPYISYGKMATEDIYSIIAYIRSLPQVESKPPFSKANFPMNIILHTIPEKPAPGVIPSKTDSINYGEYLVGAGACIDCHTPTEKNQIVMDKAFSGGREFLMPSGILHSANITPDNESGIGTWTKASFIARFKAYDLSIYNPAILNKGDLMTLMPWTMYAGMDTTDLAAIYAYLKTIKPLKNAVTKWIAK